MAKVNWKSQEDIDKELLKQREMEEKKKTLKNKKFTTLSTKEKDELLEILARQAGLIE